MCDGPHSTGRLNTKKRENWTRLDFYLRLHAFYTYFSITTPVFLVLVNTSLPFLLLVFLLDLLYSVHAPFGTRLTIFLLCFPLNPRLALPRELDCAARIPALWASVCAEELFSRLTTFLRSLDSMARVAARSPRDPKTPRTNSVSRTAAAAPTDAPFFPRGAAGAGRDPRGRRAGGSRVYSR